MSGAESSSIFNLVLKEGGLIVGLGAHSLVGAFFLWQTLQACTPARWIHRAAVAGMLPAVALIARAAREAGGEDRSADCVKRPVIARRE